ncbi:MAG: hypothetical protein CMB74_00970 [Euryarchaeota archaeon]|nr:hypothetical protein [Euryarchaeota archaeon]
MGEHVTNAFKSPWKIPFLPLTFPIHVVLLGLEKLGLKAKPARYNPLTGLDSESKNCVLLFPTNGVGFGHFTRMYAVAKAVRKHDPFTEVIFFTPMPTLHVPYVDDFPTYHMAGKYKFNDMSSSKWNGLIEEQLLMILDAHQPKLFVFDGAFPYRGMLNAIKRKSSMRKVWMRRGMFKKGSRIPAGSVEFFDTVVHPGDAIQERGEKISHNVEEIHVPPILLVDEHEKLTKAESRSRLGVPDDVIVWYLQLGAGQINDIESEVRITVECILESDSSCYIVIGESLLGQRIDFQHERVRLLRDYPNSIYLNGIDYSVQAGGYNSFHEMRVSRTPTIFFPNMKTGMDDQNARCKVAVDEGWGVVVETRTRKNILLSIAEVQSINPGDDIIPDKITDMGWVESLL